MTSIGIFGGSFDPIHFGHLILADTCREHLQLDRVLLIPAATSPLKPRGPVASNEDRLEMCRLAVGGTPGLEVDPIELERGGVSFTLDTVMMIKQREPEGTKVVLLVGSDSLLDFHRWKEPARLLQEVQLGVVHRAGYGPPDFSPLRNLLNLRDQQQFNPQLVPMPNVQISSTELRQRVSSGNSIRFRLPRAIEAYIASHKLYADVSSIR